MSYGDKSVIILLVILLDLSRGFGDAPFTLRVCQKLSEIALERTPRVPSVLSQNAVTRSTRFHSIILYKDNLQLSNFWDF